MAFLKNVTTLKSYITRRNDIGYNQSHVIKKAFDTVRALHKDLQTFENGEPVLHHLLDTAEELKAWGMPDNVIGAALLHREDISADVFKNRDLAQIIPILKAYKHIEDYVNPLILSKLIPANSVRDNFQNMLLGIKDFASLGGDISEKTVFFAHILRAADQISTLKASQASSWDADRKTDQNTYSWIALSNALFLKNINMEAAAGHIFDIVYGRLNPEERNYYYNLFYENGAHHKMMLDFKEETFQFLRDKLPSAFFKLASDHGSLRIKDRNLKFDVFSRIKTIYGYANKIKKEGLNYIVGDKIGLRIVLNSDLKCDSIDKYKAAKSLAGENNLTVEELENLRKDYTSAIEAVYLCSNAITQFVEDQGWEEITGRYRDFVSIPKDNGYQAIQRTFRAKTPSGWQNFEIQIRTQGMHDWAEWGGASHSEYHNKRYENVRAFGDQRTISNLEKNGDMPKSSFEKYLNLATALNNKVFAFVYDWNKKEGIIQTEGPFALDPMNEDKNIVALDLAFAKGINLGLKAAQFLKYNPNKGMEQEYGAAKPINSNAYFRIITADRATVTEERVKAAGTEIARRELEKHYYSGVASNSRTFDKGKDLYNNFLEEIKIKHLGLLSKSVAGAKIIKSKTFVPEKNIIEGLNFISIKDFMIFLGNNGVKNGTQAFIAQNSITMSYDGKKSQICFIYKNSNYTNCLLRHLKAIGINILSLNIFKPNGDMILKAKTEKFDSNVLSEIEKAVGQDKILAQKDVLGIYYKKRTAELLINKMDNSLISKIADHIMASEGEISGIDMSVEQKSTESQLNIRFPANITRTEKEAAINSLMESNATGITSEGNRSSRFTIEIKFPVNLTITKMEKAIKSLKSIPDIQKVIIRN